MRPRGRELPFRELVASAVYSPDGTTIIATTHKNSIVLFDISTNHIRHLWHAGEDVELNESLEIAIPPDGRHIACCVGEAVLVLDAASGAQVTSMQHDSGLTCVAYSQDGTRIASGTEDDTLRLWDTATGAVVGRHLDAHPQGVSAVSFSPDGICLGSASDDGTLRLWDSTTCAPMATFELPGGVDLVVYAIAFSPAGIQLIAGRPDGVVIWDVRQWRSIHIFNTACSSVAFSPRGRYLAVGSEDGRVGIWGVQEGKQVRGPLIGPGQAVSSVCFSADEKSLAVTAEDGKVRVWELFD